MEFSRLDDESVSKESGDLVVPLIGVKITDRSDGPETTVVEFHLDDNNRAFAAVGKETMLAETTLEDGVESDHPYANQLGNKYGVSMPAESKLFNPEDGVRFLIAFMSEQKGNQYSGTYPIEG